jgi:prepilin-type N-terminal cleavage/methylation domain-containing protein
MTMPLRMIARAKGRAEREGGMSLVELMVTMMVLSIVMLIFTTMLASIQRAQSTQDKRSRDGDSARLALEDLDRQVRSGNLLYNPTTEASNDPYGGGAGYLFRIYTQANAPVVGYHCAAFLIDNKQQLLYRYWPANQPEYASSWRVVATGIVNRSLSTSAFALDSTTRTITITFKVNTDLTNSPSATQTLSTSVTGRNTQFGYPSNVCATLPSPLV